MSAPRLTALVLLLTALLLGATSLALADVNNAQDYYQFRHSSCLPGMLFGVTPEGQVGFDGAFQQNIPVAFTPCDGNWVVGGNSGSNSSSLELGSDTAKVNGTLFAARGWLTPGHALYVAWEATGTKIEEAWHAQYQVLPLTEGRPAVAIGVLDLFNERERFIGQSLHNARSIYVTATGSLRQATWRPIYWTAGWGTGRFRNGFAGLSVPVSDRVRVVAEYDSFDPNVGVAFGLNPLGTDERWNAVGYFGYTNLKQPMLGLTCTLRPF